MCPKKTRVSAKCDVITPHLLSSLIDWREAGRQLSRHILQIREFSSDTMRCAVFVPLGSGVKGERGGGQLPRLDKAEWNALHGVVKVAV